MANTVKKPFLGGGITSQEWLEQAARSSINVRAYARAREAVEIANYINALEKAVDERNSIP